MANKAKGNRDKEKKAFIDNLYDSMMEDNIIVTTLKMKTDRFSFDEFANDIKNFSDGKLRAKINPINKMEVKISRDINYQKGK